MELHSIGGYTLLSPLRVERGAARFFRARGNEEPQDAPATYLAKVLLPGRGPHEEILAAQFRHEAQLLEACNHPGIPGLHATGEQDGVAYIVMDWVDGVDLACLLGHDRGQPAKLSREVAVYVMALLADALHHAHGIETVQDGRPVPLGLVHRDLCPSNVFLSRQGDVLLGDFGAARSLWLAPEHDMPRAGHLAYLAPERLREPATPATPAADLFSLAVMLWEALRGERCFRGDSDTATLEAIGRVDPAALTRKVPGLSAKLSEVLRRNLDPDPARRYEDAYQMLQRLSQAPEARAAEQARAELARMVGACADA
jgi:serine/threonine-protein kinase